MDKYIRMLLVKLAPKYKAIVTTIMYYDPENERFANIIKLKVKNKYSGEEKDINLNGKQELVKKLAEMI